MGLYTEHESGIDLDSGDVGGDDQATAAASRRFQRQLDDGTWAIVTVYAFGTSKEVDEGASYQHDVEVMTEYMVCSDVTDPGSTEIDADYRYWFPFDVGPDTPEKAYEWACNYIRGLDVEDVDWNGNTRSV